MLNCGMEIFKCEEFLVIFLMIEMKCEGELRVEELFILWFYFFF